MTDQSPNDQFRAYSFMQGHNDGSRSAFFVRMLAALGMTVISVLFALAIGEFFQSGGYVTLSLLMFLLSLVAWYVARAAMPRARRAGYRLWTAYFVAALPLSTIITFFLIMGLVSPSHPDWYSPLLATSLTTFTAGLLVSLGLCCEPDLKIQTSTKDKGEVA